MTENIEVKLVGNIVMVGLPDEIFVEEATILRETLNRYIDKEYTSITCEFKNVKYIDSSGLGVLVAINKRLHQIDGHLVISNLTGKVKELFELTRLINVFHIK